MKDTVPSKASTVAEEGSDLETSKGTAPSTPASVINSGTRACWVLALYKMYWPPNAFRHVSKKDATGVRVGEVTLYRLCSQTSFMFWTTNAGVAALRLVKPAHDLTENCSCQVRLPV